jgi:hypothetical protein
MAVVLAGCGNGVTARSGAAAGAEWRVSEEYAPGSSEPVAARTGEASVVASTSSATGFQDSMHIQRTPELRLVCNPGLYFVYLDIGMPLEPGAGADATVSWTLDGGAAVLSKAVHVTNQRFWIRDAGLIRRIFSAQTMAVQFRPLDSSGYVRSTFSLAGLAPALRDRGAGCFDPLMGGQGHN